MKSSLATIFVDKTKIVGYGQRMNDLHLFNSLSRSMEVFTPVHPGEARIYTCGPTVYNYAHIGNMRAYVFADLLGRTLSYQGYKLSHVINITDVGHLTDDADSGEDKMEKMAQNKAQSIWDIAKHYTEAYWNDIKALNIRGPFNCGKPDDSYWSIATNYVPKMIAFAQSIEKHCYELPSGLYFDVTTVEDHGYLSRSTGEDRQNRIEKLEGKRNVADFAIWRKTPEGETRQMEWDSPWGRGAPGWHLECSVMSQELLGFPFDIHTGGIDHREIHHPNEIAQNQAICGCGSPTTAENSGARVWMHNNFLVERNGKMTKSSGDVLRLQSLIDKGFHPMSYRLMCLQAHYRSELEFSWEGLRAAQTRLSRIIRLVESIRDSVPVYGDNEAFLDAIYHDLNTPVALTALDELLSSKKSPEEKLGGVLQMDEILGLGLDHLTRVDLRVRPTDSFISEVEIEELLDIRRKAKNDRDFTKADTIRQVLVDKGIEVMDGDLIEWSWK